MLDELGRTADEVADALRDRNILGVRNTVRILNPIVRYALETNPDATAIDLIQADRLRIAFATGQVSDFAVPEPVLQFLERFHRGEYPNLEMPTGPG